MRVTVLLFAALADEAGARQLELELPSGATTGAVWDQLRRGHPLWGEVGHAVLLAVNGEFCSPSTPLQSGDTVALLPPMSGGAPPEEKSGGAPPIEKSGGAPPEEKPGGAPERRTALVRGPLPPPPAWSDCAIGATVRFDGIARNFTPAAPGRVVLRLEYEAYESMAASRLADIAEEASERWGLNAIEILHRLGSVPVGEASVRVITAAPHRAAAFAACRFAIDTLKRSVPIWKKEVFADGSHWAEGGFPAGESSRGAQSG